jgi:hypothetical protein
LPAKLKRLCSFSSEETQKVSICWELSLLQQNPVGAIKPGVFSGFEENPLSHRVFCGEINKHRATLETNSIELLRAARASLFLYEQGSLIRATLETFSVRVAQDL